MNQTVCYKQVLGRLWPGSRRLPRDNDSAQAALRVWSNETFRTTFKTEPFWIPRSTVHKGKWRKNSRHLKACAMETSAGRTIAKWCKMGNFQCKMWKDVKSINQKGQGMQTNHIYPSCPSNYLIISLLSICTYLSYLVVLITGHCMDKRRIETKETPTIFWNLLPVGVHHHSILDSQNMFRVTIILLSRFFYIQAVII